MNGTTTTELDREAMEGGRTVADKIIDDGKMDGGQFVPCYPQFILLLDDPEEGERKALSGAYEAANVVFFVYCKKQSFVIALLVSGLVRPDNKDATQAVREHAAKIAEAMEQRMQEKLGIALDMASFPMPWMLEKHGEQWSGELPAPFGPEIGRMLAELREAKAANPITGAAAASIAAQAKTIAHTIVSGGKVKDGIFIPRKTDVTAMRDELPDLRQVPGKTCYRLANVNFVFSERLDFALMVSFSGMLPEKTPALFEELGNQAADFCRALGNSLELKLNGAVNWAPEPPAWALNRYGRQWRNVPGVAGQMVAGLMKTQKAADREAKAVLKAALASDYTVNLLPFTEGGEAPELPDELRDALMKAEKHMLAIALIASGDSRKLITVDSAHWHAVHDGYVMLRQWAMNPTGKLSFEMRTPDGLLPDSTDTQH